jgi:hypothetical protein
LWLGKLFLRQTRPSQWNDVSGTKKFSGEFSAKNFRRILWVRVFPCRWRVKVLYSSEIVRDVQELQARIENWNMGRLVSSAEGRSSGTESRLSRDTVHLRLRLRRSARCGRVCACGVLKRWRRCAFGAQGERQQRCGNT